MKWTKETAMRYFAERLINPPIVMERDAVRSLCDASFACMRANDPLPPYPIVFVEPEDEP